MEFEYWRSRLNLVHRRVYDKICNAVRTRDKSLDFTSVNAKDIQECYNAVFYDHPELFWMSSKVNICVTSSHFATKSTLILDYIYSLSEVNAVLRKAESIIKITKGRTQEETENRIVDYVVKNTEYEINNDYNQNMASSLYYGKAQCSGISKAVKYLCDRSGIKCIFVCGELNGGAHGWNIIEIGGNFYHLDVTIILGSNQDKTGKLFKPYFNWNDGQMVKTHRWDKHTLPRCVSTYNAENLSDETWELTTSAGSRRQSSSYEQTTVRPTATAKNDNIVKFTTLLQLRTYIESELQAKKSTIVFRLTLGANEEERLKLIINATKMVIAKMQLYGSFNVEVNGEVNTIKVNN